MRAERPCSRSVFIAALCAMRMTVSREQYAPGEGCEEIRFPHPLAPWEGLGRRRPPRNYFHPVGVRRSSSEKRGETGFPHTPARGRVWAGAAPAPTRAAGPRTQPYKGAYARGAYAAGL